MTIRLLRQLAKQLGWRSADELSGFFACGISVLPITLIVVGQPAAAGVSLIVLICALLCCSMLSGDGPQESESEVHREENKRPPGRRH
ncbi:hypothetical protein [Rhodocyclus tenuis]|uniref:hypothetical protein n=1 Tax=Rhodocyclus tenuis TaxID=1066 RepID=UPI001908A79B|nr:hypothetical protein [Rhodocyclus tenuis]MBK1679534.1 hypothetical protein [Rhodocyclus tenuis]